MTQENEILNYLKLGNTLTPLESLRRFSCMRLASRVSDLKKKGYNIKMRMVHGDNGKRYAQYYMPPELIVENKGQFEMVVT